MKLLACLLLIVPLSAQDAPKPTEAAPAAAPSPDAAPPPAPPAADAPSGDKWLQGSINFGYRWIPNISGDFNTYRSVVNLGVGPKLLDADFTVSDPHGRVFDRADVHATSWGGDPYNTLGVDMQRHDWYRLTVDYRNIAYFNFLPSFANPLLSEGSLLDQNSFDTAIRNTNVQLDLMPDKWITPYLRFSRDTQCGRGITDFTAEFNEYPVASLYSDQTNAYRAGVRMEMSATT